MSDTEMTEKRSADEFEEEETSKKTKYEEVSTEDLEEAMYQIKKAAAKGRAHLESKAKEHFESRNGFSPTSGEMEDCFNKLRDSMIDEDAAQSSSDEEEEDSEEFSKLQSDLESAFEHTRDLGKEAGKKMKSFMKDLWCKENNGGEPSSEETEAVMYNLKHMCMGMCVVEEESETEEEDYEPSELEKETYESEEQEDCQAEYEECSFDFPSQCEVSESQFEEMCSKFTAEKGRTPTSEEADALLECFKQKLCDASFGDSDSDYEAEEEEESEEESCAEDTSLEEAEGMELEEEEEEEQEFSAENKSDAFGYMEELEEPSSGEEEEEEEEAEKEEEPEQESSKVQQAQEMTMAHQVCA